MSTIKITLSESLKSFVEDRVRARGYGSASEYVRELIRRERDRQNLRDQLLEGAASPLAGMADAAYFDRLRLRVRDAGGQ